MLILLFIMLSYNYKCNQWLTFSTGVSDLLKGAACYPLATSNPLGQAS